MDLYEEIYSPIIDKAASRNIALEINSHSQKDPDEAFVQEAILKNVKSALGTDSHALKEFGDFSWQFDLLARCGIKSEKELEKVLFREGK